MPPPPHRRRRRLRWALGAVAVLLLVAGGGLAVLVSREPGDVSNPDVPFSAPSTTPTTRTAQAAPASGAGAFAWPVYGYDLARTRYLPLEQPFRPPFTPKWKLGGSVLLEFPPAMGGTSLFLLKNNGALYRIARTTGRVVWKRKLGTLAASQPAYAHGTVYVVLLERGRGVKAGRVAAIRAKDGTTRWSRKLPSRAESSPLIRGDDLVFGTEDGTVYDLRASDGLTRWRHRAKGAVKGGVAYADGRLFFGDYAGNVTALRARDGSVAWRKSTRGGRFGLASGNFYATPAAAYGRVYLGSTDGFVSSFAQRDGALAWRTKTGGYVYGSPAVGQVDGGRPTVYVGSYDQRFYAMDARTGKVRWKHRAEGRVSGGAVLLGDLVFYSTLKKTTTALGARTGREVWSVRRGGFNPVVSDGRDLFIVGYTSLFGYDGRPNRATRSAAAAQQRLNRRVAARKRSLNRRVAARKRSLNRRVAARKRSLNRRVAARRRAVARRRALIASGARFCSGHGRGRVCRAPQPLVCLKRSSDGRTVCRPKARRPGGG